MRQGFVRGLALCALTVVALAPVATAGAAGGGSGASPATASAVHLTWAQVGARLQEKADAQRARGRAAHRSTDPARARAAATAPSPPGAGALRAAAATATPTLTVTPATGLVAGQAITVAGAGFAAGRYIVTECEAGGSDPSSCDLSGAALVVPDGQGAFSTDAHVHRTLRIGPTSLDCASHAAACEMVAIDLSTFATAIARAALALDPNAPLPHPTITVAPSTLLRTGQSVTVSGSGFVAGDQLTVSQCASSDLGCFQSDGGVSPFVGPDGRFTTAVSVHLRINDAFGNLTTCVAVGCSIQAGSYTNPDYVATAPITFDPSQPIPPPPTITVTPHSGLRHDQQVEVHGINFDPSSEISINECGNNEAGYCDEYLADLQADGSGAFTQSVVVSRLVRQYAVEGPDTGTTVDCAVVACTLTANGYSATDPVSLDASAPIAFDASVPPPPLPTVTVTPHTNLPYRTTVAVHGTGFGPNESVSADYCAQAANGDATCGGLGSGFGTTDAHGVIDLSVPVSRRVGFLGEGIVVDCIDPGTKCSVEVSGPRGYEQTEVDLTFDPTSQIPPPPVATVSPDHGLGYHAAVAVTGSGFAPGTASATECGTGPPELPGFTFCAGPFEQFAVDASGHLSGTAAVDRVLSFGPGSPAVDCATAATPCYLQIGDGTVDGSVSVPLGFDPNSQPPPPPTLTVTPSTGLFDGRHVTVAGANFTPGSLVGVTECTAGTAAIADGCDLGQVRIATVGADGTFSRRYVTESVLGTADGPIDCSTAPNRCVLAAANAPIGQDYASAPLSFDPPQLTVQGVGVPEGTGGMTMAPVRVMLSKPDRNPITVHWMAEPGTATQGRDFTSMRGTLTIPAGATEAMIDASVVADAIDEPTETFRIRVVDALGTRVTDRVGTVTIHDDDTAPAVTVHDTRRREDHGEAQAEVTLSAPSGRTVIVHYVTHHLTARAGSDYVRKDGRLVFLPGETRHLVRVVLVDDAVHEATETFSVVLDEVEQATIARGTATVTVTDDD